MRRVAGALAVTLFAVLVLVLFAAVQSEAAELPCWEVDDRPAPFRVDVPTLSFDVDFAEPEQEWAEPEYVEPYVEEAYYEPTCYTQAYAGDPDNFQMDGVVHEGGVTYTWYPQSVLPGGGLTELNENGRTVNGEGFVTDGDGYLAVASSDYPMGTHLDTPWGEGVVYDTGCPSGTIDMYTDW